MSDSALESYHVPAMAREVIEFLNPHGEGLWVDNTLGGAGHARLICQKLEPGAIFLGIDRDPKALEVAGQRLAGEKCNVVIRHSHFSQVGILIDEFGGVVQGSLWDLGLSGDQIDRGTGFSMRDLDAGLDFRQDTTQSLTAKEILDHTPEKDLADIIFRNSDERFSRRIASAIVRARPLDTVGDLVDVVKGALPRGYRNMDDVLRRTMQALRMEVNSEIPELQESLEAVAGRLAPGARMVVLSYHSGEDRVVKQFLRRGRLEGFLRVLTPKPLRPQDDEIKLNPRAKPARLRAAEKIGPLQEG